MTDRPRPDRTRGAAATGLARTATGAALLLAGLLACGGGSAPVQVPAPAGLSVQLLQYRADYTPRRIQLKVVNDGDAPVTVTGARLSSARFVADALWSGAETIPAHTRTDLPAPLAGSDCTAGQRSAPRVQLTFRLADGRTGRVWLTPTDEFGVLDTVHTADCWRERVLAISAIRLADQLRTVRAAGQLIGVLRLELVPTGAPGTLRVESIGPTTLLSPERGRRWQVGLELSAGSGPRSVALRIRPDRCDPHAVGEDKLGTVLRVSVRIGDRSGVIAVAASTALRAQIYDYVVAACR